MLLDAFTSSPTRDAFADTTEFPIVERDSYYEAALTWVNEKRAEQGKRPLYRLPRGVAASQCHCVLGRSTGYAFSDSAVYWTRGGDGDYISYPLPEDVAEFEYRFERGGYPGLLAGVQKGRNGLAWPGVAHARAYNNNHRTAKQFPVIA